MIFAALALVVSVQQPQYRDSAEVTRLLAGLRSADSTVCQLAGRALTNFGRPKRSPRWRATRTPVSG